MLALNKRTTVSLKSGMCLLLLFVFCCFVVVLEISGLHSKQKKIIEKHTVKSLCFVQPDHYNAIALHKAESNHLKVNPYHHATKVVV